MLGELAQMALVTCRAHAAADVAAAHAVEEIMADDYWQPETGRARALAGAKDAADAFQKVSRALRLTLKLEIIAAETARDIRVGIVTHTAQPHSAGEDAGALAVSAEGQPDRRRPAGSDPADRDADPSRSETDTEHLVEFERPDVLPRTPFCQTVNRIRAELNTPVDWSAWKVGSPELQYTGLQPKPPGWSECRPPASYALTHTLEPAPKTPARSP